MLPLLLHLALSASPPPPPPCPDGRALIRAMYERYAGQWYRTVTFTQTTTFTEPTSRVETWYEAARIPGQLRIDVAPVDSANMILFRGDSLYRFAAGNRIAGRPLIHPLMVLGFDVYAQPPGVTIARLLDLGFDLDQVSPAWWQNRGVCVVGAAAGDTSTPQFWIERDRLLFVRMLRPGAQGAVQETQFNRYIRLGGGWIAVEVLFLENGRLTTREDYTDVRGEVLLPDSLFTPIRYHPPAWVRAPGG